MSRSYGRVVIVDVGPSGGQARRITGLRIAFTARKAATGMADPCEISVWNPAPDTIRILERDDTVTRLLAGYGTAVQLAMGSIVANSLRITHEGPDRIARWQVHDGGAALQATQVSYAWGTTVTAAEVIAEVARQAGLAIGTVNPGPLAYVGGWIAFGSVRETLDTIAADTSCRWSVQDGRLSFWPVKDAKQPAVGPLIAVETGMIGSPAPMTNGVEVKALLMPAIRPGDPFAIRSERVSGAFVATNITHTGDSGFAPEFYTTIQAVPR